MATTSADRTRRKERKTAVYSSLLLVFNAAFCQDTEDKHYPSHLSFGLGPGQCSSTSWHYYRVSFDSSFTFFFGFGLYYVNERKGMTNNPDLSPSLPCTGFAVPKTKSNKNLPSFTLLTALPLCCYMLLLAVSSGLHQTPVMSRQSNVKQALELL